MKERNLFSGDSITFLGLKKKKKLHFQPERKWWEIEIMMQMLIKLQGSECMFKNNHAVGVVDKALVYIIIVVKLIFLQSFIKPWNHILLNYTAICRNL